MVQKSSRWKSLIIRVTTMGFYHPILISKKRTATILRLVTNHIKRWQIIRYLCNAVSLIKNGKLLEFLADVQRKQDGIWRQHKTNSLHAFSVIEVEQQGHHPPNLKVNTVARGPTMAGTSKGANNNYVRSTITSIANGHEVNLNHMAPNQQVKHLMPIIFADNDIDSIFYPHHDVLVVTMNCLL